MRKVLEFGLLACILPVVLIYRAFGGHFCQDEMYLLFMSIPAVGGSVAWLRAKFHHKKEHKDCDHG